MRYLAIAILCLTALPARADDTVSVSPALVQAAVAALNKSMMTQCGEMDQVVRQLVAALPKQEMPKALLPKPPGGVPAQQ